MGQIVIIFILDNIQCALSIRCATCPDIGTAIDESFHHALLAFTGGKKQWRIALFIAELEVWMMFEQRLESYPMLQTADVHALYIWVDGLFWQDVKVTHIASKSAI